MLHFFIFSLFMARQFKEENKMTDAVKEEIISEDLETKSRLVRITEPNGKTFMVNKTIRDDEPVKKEEPKEEVTEDEALFEEVKPKKKKSKK